MSQKHTKQTRKTISQPPAEDLYRVLFEQAADGIFIVDTQGRCLEVNQQSCKMLGYTREELLAMSLPDLIPAEDLACTPIHLADLTPGEAVVVERLLCCRDGCLLPVEIKAQMLADGRVVGHVRDMTERKQAEEALKASEARFATIFQASPLAISITRLKDQQLTEVNQAWQTMTGFSREETIGRTPLELDNWANPGEREQLLSQLRQQGTVHGFEMQIRHKSGILLDLLISAELVEVADERCLLTLALDITERKQMEGALRQSEEKYRSLIDSQDAAISTIDAEGVIHYMNQIGAAPLADSPQAVVGRNLYDFFPPHIVERQLQYIRQVITTGQGLVDEYQNIVAGQPSWRRVSIQPVRNAAGQVVLATINSVDITERKRAEQELLELNRTLEERVKQRTAEVQDMYDNAPTGYHSLDAAGNFVMINQTELNWLGYSREEVIGHPLADFLTPPSAARFYESFRVFKQRGWARDLEYEFIRKDGSTFPTLLNGTAIYDEQGNFLMSRSTLFDNTERKKAEIALKESEEQNRLLFEESPDAVILFDAAGRVVRANRAAEMLTGYPNAQLAGRTLDELDLLSAEQIEKLAAAVLQTLQLADSFAIAEFRLKRADGESHDVGTRVFGLKIQDRQHYLATMRDITADKQAATTLRQANTELARAARAKDEFLANMSHELRTPLNAVLGLSEILLEQTHGPLTERQRKSLHHIATSGQHLLDLITDILDLSKVEAGRMDLLVEPVPVAEVCQASLSFVKEVAQKKQLNLSLHLNNQLAVVQADSKRLKQMLVNLLSNAVKFTPAGGQVSLEVNTDAEAGVIRFAVQDTGIGITPEDLIRLFQPFTQVDSSLNRHHEGTGLGLALVRRLAELHGGSVTVESVVDQGSRFTIALPYPSPDRGEKPPLVLPAEPQTRGGLPRKALVVEDSESEAEQLARYLRETNIHVTVHLQGEGALEQAAHLQPDVILLDLLMPDQSGWMVLSQLKADPRTREIPVIIISIVDERAKGIAAGAAQYLVKPISREGLWQALRTAVLTPKAIHEALVIAPRPQPVLSGARILLAEDNEVNIEATEDYLQSKGYQVIVARNGHEALDLAFESQPDLILMDIQMPKMDGLEATRRLRARFEFATIPIIALTALAMPGDWERCLEAGVNEYLTKPVGLKMLTQKIEELLEKKRKSAT